MCTQHQHIGIPMCTQHQHIGIAMCTQHQHIGIPMCTQHQHIGIAMCTQHQWLSLLCRPEDDRMMGRNMWLYVLTKQIILTYIFNFIIYKINKYCHYLKQSCRIRVRNFLLMLRFGRLRNNLLYLRPNGRSGQMAVEVSRFSSFMCHVNLIELITLGTVRFMRGL